MTRALVAALALLVAACATPGSPEPHRYFVLEVPDAAPVTRRAPLPRSVIVPPTTAAGFYDTQDMVYSRAPGTRAYYQFNSWTERPSRSIHALLVSRLERANLFREVAEPGGGMRGELVLRTHLDEIYHDAATEPGSARISLAAELADQANATVVARRTFTQSMPVASYDAQGAAAAFRAALGVLLDEVVAWLDTAAPGDR
jgi:cholesterol transport system auxiliary component